MCLSVKQTLIRGRCAVPLNFWRRRRWRRSRDSTRVRGIMTQLSCCGHRLAGFAADLLGDVPDAFALVRLGWIEATDARGNFTDQLLVRAFNRDLRLLVLRVRDGDLDVLRNRKRNRMGIAQRHLQVLSLHRRTETDALDEQLLRIAIVDALDHVGDETAGESPARLADAIKLRGRREDLAVLDLDLDRWRHCKIEFSLRPLDVHSLSVHFHLGLRRNLNWFLADA